MRCFHRGPLAVLLVLCILFQGMLVAGMTARLDPSGMASSALSSAEAAPHEKHAAAPVSPPVHEVVEHAGIGCHDAAPETADASHATGTCDRCQACALATALPSAPVASASPPPAHASPAANVAVPPSVIDDGLERPPRHPRA